VEGQGRTAAGASEFPLECAHWLEVLTSLSAMPSPRSISGIRGGALQPGGPGGHTRPRGRAEPRGHASTEHHVLQLHPSPPAL